MAKRRRPVSVPVPHKLPDRRLARTSVLLPQLLALLGIASLGVIFFAHTLHYPLTFDDVNFFAPEIFQRNVRQPVWSARWLSNVSFLWPGWEAVQPILAWRLGNLVLHICNGMLVYALVIVIARQRVALGDSDRLTGLSWAALFAALAFVLHPIAAYGVTYLVQRSIVLATLCGLLALGCVVLASRSGRMQWWFAALACMALAISSKPHALPFVVALASLAWLLAPAGLNRWWLLTVILAAVLATMWVVIPHATLLFAAGEPYVRSLGLAQGEGLFVRSVLTQCALFFRYLLLILLPSTSWMSVDVRVPLLPLGLFGFLATAGFVAIFLGSLYGVWRWHARGAALVCWALLAFLALFLVELATERIQEPFVLYRAYLWMAPIWIAAGVLLARASVKRWLMACCAGWLVFAGWGLADRQATFASQEALWTDAIDKLPETPVFFSQRPYANRGMALLQAGDAAGAIQDLNRALAIAPAHYEVLINRANAFAKSAQKDLAVRDLERAAALQPASLPLRPPLRSLCGYASLCGCRTSLFARSSLHAACGTLR